MVNPFFVIVGFIIVLITVGGLLYIFYSRSNAVEKNGYGALVMLALVSLMIPVFWIMEAGNQTSAQADQQTIAVQRGLALYAQYCVADCYKIQSGKVVDATYNGYPMATLANMKVADITRIVYAGIYSPSATPPANTSLIPKSQNYAGPLDSNDVGYLVAFIQSSTASGSVNGLNRLASYLQTNNPSAYATASAPPPPAANLFGTPVDMTSKKAITIDIVNAPAGAKCQPACFSPVNVKVKVGTVITWVNMNSLAHTVTAINGTNVSSPSANAQMFDSGLTPGIKTGQSFKWTVTMAAYNYLSTHFLYYYCQYHPTMVAQLTIVP
ncbi:MAG TPA: plastocyanin/azurin family copper-binding protein [Ktedonobacteraceae bacterium]|nr:plastocyanin/azurin family copper-binding protein [Ktedonobacteraceae bacterium]